MSEAAMETTSSNKRYYHYKSIWYITRERGVSEQLKKITKESEIKDQPSNSTIVALNEKNREKIIVNAKQATAKNLQKDEVVTDQQSGVGH